MKLFILITFFISFKVHSEYRVYQYITTNKIQSSIDQPKSQVLLSTLDPVSYIAYNGGSHLINVELMRTWICPGSTNYKRNYCDSPYKKIKELL